MSAGRAGRKRKTVIACTTCCSSRKGRRMVRTPVSYDFTLRQYNLQMVIKVAFESKEAVFTNPRL
jgi:hypothetical protein